MFTMPKTGLTIQQAEDKDLVYWAERKEADHAKDPSAKFADKNLQEAKWMRDELARRAKGGKKADAPASAPKPAPSAAIVPKHQDAVLGKYLGGDRATKALIEASQSYHLVSPMTSCGSLPHGCEVVLTSVLIDVRRTKAGGDVDEVGGGKLSLSANGLKKIQAAAGLSWDPILTRRQDNGRDPLYCHFKAVGYVRNFDGSPRTVSGEVELDLRDESPQVKAMYGRARGDTSNVDNQLRDMRLYILRHAETKAKNRATADMGVKRSYTEADLQKPFAVAQLMFTGRSENPALEAMFASKIADNMLGGRTMYGGTGVAPPAPSPAMLPYLQGHSDPVPVFHGHEAPRQFAPADDHALETEAEEEPVGNEPAARSEAAGATQTTLPGTGTDGKRY